MDGIQPWVETEMIVRYAATGSLVAILLVDMAGCAATDFSLDPYLERAIGRRVGDIDYPRLEYKKVQLENEGEMTIQYSIDSLWRCRWNFVIDRSTGIVKAWSYPDETAAKWCRELPKSRP